MSPVEKGRRKAVRFRHCCSNLVLDELDREMQRRGHRFVRYRAKVHFGFRS